MKDERAGTPDHESRVSIEGERLLLKTKEAAEMCGKSVRTWRAWDAAGRIPRPIRIGRSTNWRPRELQEWVAAGCPNREQWEAQR